jgi:hypothetical protein
MSNVKRRVGRPPKPANPGTIVTITIRLGAEDKNMILDKSEAVGLTMGEYLTSLVRRDA